jgi:hypothetical protein
MAGKILSQNGKEDYMGTSISTTYTKPVENNNKPTWELINEEYRKELHSQESFPFWEEIERLFIDRDNFGRNKYGMPLQSFNGQDSILETIQETLDQIAYAKNMCEEYKGTSIEADCFSIYRLAIIQVENLYMVYKKRELSRV